MYLYSDCLRRESNFNTPGHCLVRACLLHCMNVRLRNGYTQAYVQIMQYTHTLKAVTGRVEAKSYSLVEGNQTIDDLSCGLTLQIPSLAT